jgi:hypothetical protein
MPYTYWDDDLSRMMEEFRAELEAEHMESIQKCGHELHKTMTYDGVELIVCIECDTAVDFKESKHKPKPIPPRMVRY